MVEIKQDIARRQVGMGDSVEHQRDGDFADVEAGLANGGQRHGQQAGVFYIVKTHNFKLLRDFYREFVQRSQGQGRRVVVGADQAVGPQFCQHLAQGVGVFGVADIGAVRALA